MLRSFFLSLGSIHDIVQVNGSNDMALIELINIFQNIYYIRKNYSQPSHNGIPISIQAKYIENLI